MDKFIEQPDWDLIRNLCSEKIIERFPKYGNGWNSEYLDNDWWNMRLDYEVKECKESKHMVSRIGELVDIINICAMQITNHRSYIKCGE